MSITNTNIFSNATIGSLFNRTGAGIANADHSVLSLTNSSVTSNTARDWAGGIINQGDAIMTITNSSVVSNTAEEGGGIVNLDRAVMQIFNSTIAQNNATAHHGGIKNHFAYLTINDSRVLSNTTGGDGGGIGVHSTGVLTVVSSTVAHNTAQANGGGIFVIFSTATISNSTVVSNTAQRGGGFYQQQSAGAYLADNVMNYNTAQAEGGGIFSVLSTLTVIDTDLISNVSQTNGGGIYNDRTTLNVSNSRLMTNTAQEGGALYQKPTGAVTLLNNCIVFNTNTAVYRVSGTAINAANNWWGNPSGPSGVGPGIGDSISANVNFAPPLAASIFGCPTWGPELGVSKQVQPIQSVQGRPVTYTIPFSNSGNFTATNVIITDVVPISISISSVTSSTYGGSIVITQTSNGPTFTWAMSGLPTGAGGVITLTGVITSDLRVLGSHLTNTVTSDTLGELQPSNNTISASVWVTNVRPIANAGTDQSVGVGATVTLNGSASNDPDGHTPLSYLWAQVGGPTMTLSSANAASPNFTAPLSPTVLTFTLRVTDATGLSANSTATTVVTVTDIAITGLAAQNSSPTILGRTTYLTASISAGSNVTYVWAFGDGQTGSGAIVTHTYAVLGVYTAMVTATNSLGSISITTTVKIISPPSNEPPPYKPPEPLPPNEDEADIGMQAGGSPPEAAPGEVIALVYRVSLAGERNGTSVLFVATLPAGLAFDSVTLQPSSGTCDFIAESGRVECQLGIVTQDQPVTVTLRVRAPQAGRFVVPAQAIGLDTRIVDMPGNNAVQNIIVVSPAGVGQGSSGVRLGSGFGPFVTCRAEGVCVLRWATEGAQQIVRYELVREPMGAPAASLRGGPSVLSIAPKEVDGRASYEVIDSDVLAGHTYDYTVRGIGADGAVHLLQSQRVTVPIRLFVPLVRRR